MVSQGRRVGDDHLALIRQVQDRVVQIERPDLRVVEGGRAGASMLDVVMRPQCGEALAGDAEFADELEKLAIGRLRAEHGSQKRDGPGLVRTMSMGPVAAVRRDGLDVPAAAHRADPDPSAT
jgi:hypothetical protein